MRGLEITRWNCSQLNGTLWKVWGIEAERQESRGKINLKPGPILKNFPDLNLRLVPKIVERKVYVRIYVLAAYNNRCGVKWSIDSIFRSDAQDFRFAIPSKIELSNTHRDHDFGRSNWDLTVDSVQYTCGSRLSIHIGCIFYNILSRTGILLALAK